MFATPQRGQHNIAVACNPKQMDSLRFYGGAELIPPNAVCGREVAPRHLIPHPTC
jgi:hypothetical protein